ncbi:hypothetical protein HU200_027024 [Digitaria exilis]|uniref:Uncharacterized protein n=1 Tax=Digitaria exilis TaxID=1010633 RepID=A0A835EWM5_9POAL|nr:hypothetical protein HU200_027024 [Digitaria exilis]
MSRLAGAALQATLAALLAVVLPPYYVYKLTTYLLNAVFPEDVAGKVVLITGASSGIGEHLAYEYAKRRAYLALVARREVSLRDVGDRALALGSPGVLVLPADVSKPEQCDNSRTPLHCLSPFRDNLPIVLSVFVLTDECGCCFCTSSTPDQDINFWGHVYPTRLAIPHLRKTHGRIIGVTSNSSYIFIGRNTFYNASKAAALNFYDTLRMELGGDIRITEVVPGVVESEITKGKILSKEGEMKVDQDERDAILGPTPAERVGDFARTVVRDVCRGARYVFEPRWYMGVYLLRVCLPEVLSWSSRLLTVDGAGGVSSTDTLGKWLVELPSVRRATQPPSLRSPEIKDQ